MQQPSLSKTLMIMLLGCFFISFTSGQDKSAPSGSPSIQGVKPGVWDNSNPPHSSPHHATSKEEIAMADLPEAPYPRDGNFRMGDWDFHENWRYNRDAFYRGETQPQAYREEHPYGPGGIGYDADVNYSRNLKRYQELYEKNPTSENRALLEDFVNPDHVRPYQGNFGQGSRNDAYPRQ